MHVREDRHNGAGFARRFHSPGGRVKMFDKHLVHAIVGSKDLHRGSAEFRMNLVLTRAHGSLVPTYDTSGRGTVTIFNLSRNDLGRENGAEREGEESYDRRWITGLGARLRL